MTGLFIFDAIACFLVGIGIFHVGLTGVKFDLKFDRLRGLNTILDFVLMIMGPLLSMSGILLLTLAVA